MKEIRILIFLIILDVLSVSNAQPLKECSIKTNENNYLIECDNYQQIPERFGTCENNSTINLKLIAVKNVKILKSKTLSQLNLISLDLSGNQDKMDSQETISCINQFKKLIILNMSHN